MFLPSASDPFAILLLALAIDLAFGDMAVVFRYLPHPVAMAERAIGVFDRRLNREGRSDVARQLRGAMTVAVLIGAAFAIGWALDEYLRVVHYAWAIEALLVAVLLTQRSLFEHVTAVGKALQSEGLLGGRTAVAKLVGRDPESLDEYGVARAAIGSLFENFSDGVIAPGFWYLLLGLPGLFAYKTASALASTIGHRSPRYLYFGWAAARFDDLLNWIPARLTAVLIWLAALVLPGAHGGASVRTTLADARKHRSANAGWPEAAAAGALGLALGGPRRYVGTVMNEPWLGDGRARATVADIGNALRLYLAAGACFAALLLIALGARHFR
ncbi:MAG TPA: adenosylcobinamide-phosphate synthase CbiB [Stellaceae bacterium]|jgi:adenosylcobinamide-phosphate synthase